MRILMTGSSGFLGRAVLARLRAQDHEVIRLVRGDDAADDCVSWDPAAGELKPAHVEGFDAVVHLAGESIVGERWSAAKMTRILESRITGTELLVRTLSTAKTKPAVLVSASALGFYGDRGDVELNELSGPGSGFLANVCRYWETSALEAKRHGIRVALARFGIVIGPGGGALKSMLGPFKLGVGGTIGSGDQYMSWIHIDDAVKGVERMISDDSLAGPVNLTGPAPVTNREFVRALGAALKRPTFLPMPSFAARVIFGRMADNLLLASARVIPTQLLERDFEFQHTTLESALTAALNE